MPPLRFSFVPFVPLVVKFTPSRVGTSLLAPLPTLRIRLKKPETKNAKDAKREKDDGYFNSRRILLSRVSFVFQAA
jgi:hypothetical protein